MSVPNKLKIALYKRVEITLNNHFSLNLMAYNQMNSNVIHEGVYYPFGMVIQERSYTNGEAYRFAFNGQERDDEVYGEGNSMTAEFWQYDVRIMRRWNKDPKGRKYESPYSVMGCNPIFNVDKNGDVWDPANADDSESEAVNLESHINEEKTFAQKSLKFHEKKLSKLLNKKRMTQSRERKIDIYESNIQKLKNDINQYEEQLNQLNQMRTDPDVIFRLEPLKYIGASGRTFNDGGVVVISYPAGSYRLMAEELQHGYQVLKGDLSLDKFTAYAGILYDIFDEVDSYKAGYAIDKSEYELQGMSQDDITPDFIILNGLNQSGVNGKTYSRAPMVRLSVDSEIFTLLQVYEVHIRLSTEAGYDNVFTRLGKIPEEFHCKTYKEIKAINGIEIWND